MSFWRHIFSWQGRAKRRELWFVSLMMLLPTVIRVDAGLISAVIGSLICLAIYCASLALQARRLHDLGLSAWWLLLTLAPGLVLMAAMPFFPYDWTLVRSWPLQIVWEPKQPFLAVFYSLVAMLTAYWAVLALWPGQRHDNRFGAAWRDPKFSAATA